VIRHPYEGEADCREARAYYQQVRDRQERSAQTLSNLTGWNLEQVKRSIDFIDPGEEASKPWWQRVFN